MIVYVFVSYACLWRWNEVTTGGIGGVGVVQLVVALLTLVYTAAILLVAVQSWRQARTAEAARAASPGVGMMGRTGALPGLLFAAATVTVGIPTLPVPPCH